MKTPIYIPSCGRPTNQLTYRTLNHEGITKHFDLIIVCPEKEEKQYDFYNENIDILSPDVQGIGPTRQWIMEHSRKIGYEHIIMCDDDHRWCVRKDPSAWNMREATKYDISLAFLRLQQILDSGIKLAGITARGGSNRYYPATEKYHTRQNNLHAINVKTFFDIGARYDRIPLMEDFDVILTFLRAGHKNCLITDFAWDQKGSNQKGGCSGYRTAELQETAALGLKELHPDYVRLVQKKANSGWDGMKTRTDVVLSWKKAYEESKK